jgi:hypothetical protein
MRGRDSSGIRLAVVILFGMIVLCAVTTGSVAADEHDPPLDENATETGYSTHTLDSDAAFAPYESLFLDSGHVLLAGASGTEIGTEGVGRVDGNVELRRYDADGELIWRTDVSARPDSRERLVGVEQTSDGRFVAVMRQRSRRAAETAYTVRVVELTPAGDVVRAHTVETLPGAGFDGFSVHFSDTTATDDGTVVAVGNVFRSAADMRGLIVFVHPDDETEYRVVDRAPDDRVHTVRATGDGRFVGLYTQRGPNWPQAPVEHYSAHFSTDHFEVESLPKLDRRYGDGVDQQADDSILGRYIGPVGERYAFNTYNRDGDNETAGFVVLDEEFQPVREARFPSYAEPHEDYNVTRSTIHAVKHVGEGTYLVAGRTVWYEDFHGNLDDSSGYSYERGWIVGADISGTSTTRRPIVDEPHQTMIGIDPVGDDTYTVVATYRDPDIPRAYASRLYEVGPEPEPTPTPTRIDAPDGERTAEPTPTETGTGTGSAGVTAPGFTPPLALAALVVTAGLLASRE